MRKFLSGNFSPKRKRAVIITGIVLLATAFFFILWQIEQQQPIHLTARGDAEINTDYYDLRVPAYWRTCVAVTEEPTGEVYKGFNEQQRESFRDDYCSLVIKYKANGQEYPVARLSIYQYPADRLAEEEQDNWIFLGYIRCSTCSDEPIAKDYRLNVMILDYSSVPEKLSQKDKEKWQWILDDLTSDIIYSNSKTGKYKKNNLYTDFQPSGSSNPHGSFSTWEEQKKSQLEREQRGICEYAGCKDYIDAYRNGKGYCLEHYRKSWEAEAKERDEKNVDSSSASSSSEVCKYPGCNKWAVSYRKGYCHTHYEQVYGKSRDDYYDEDPDSYYSDNKDIYRSYDEAEDDWYDEYEED